MKGKIGIAGLWDLVKHYFSYCGISGCFFLLPYYFLSGVEFGLKSSFGESGSKWLNYLLFAVLAVVMVERLDTVCEKFEGMFSDLKKLVKGVSFFKKSLWFLFIYGCFWIWNYPNFAIHIYALVIIPVGFTYDRYIALKKGNAEIYR